MDAYGGKGFQHFIDKTVSRFVGFGVRSLTLISAAVTIIFVAIMRTVWILLWPCLPLLVVLLVGYGAGVIR